MGKYDKDRALKQLAIRYCLAQKMIPCIEVVVDSYSDLTDAPEVLTDIDVLGLEYTVDGGLRRVVFDCKTSRLSAINRAFWAAGVLTYVKCDYAFVLLKSKPIYNHRISALQINVDLHDEQSFESLGKTRDIAFNTDRFYQSDVDRWNAVFEAYEKNKWSEKIYSNVRFACPLSQQPWKTFRKLIAEVRTVRGQFDPNKQGHISIYFDIIASIFMLWSTIGRDLRRMYDPAMTKENFEKALRYYIWGGKESYQVRQGLRQRNEALAGSDEFPAWERLIHFSGLVMAAPHETFACVTIAREMSIRCVSGIIEERDRQLARSLAESKRVRQFVLSASEYMISACSLPRDMHEKLMSEMNSVTAPG